MARKPLVYTSEFPYHIRARSNNQEWFSLDPTECWKIFVDRLLHVSHVYGLKVHGFTLMSNHYHLIASAHEDHDLGFVMNWLQTSVSRAINRRTGRINHTFGGRYKASLISTPEYYAHTMRYIYQNPIRAGICQAVQDYRFSTLRTMFHSAIKDVQYLPVTSPDSGIDSLMSEMTAQETISWLNELYEKEDVEIIKRQIMRPRFQVPRLQKNRQKHWLSERITK